LKHARQAVSNRERTRFCRTRIYGVARNIFFTLGEKLSVKNVTNDPRDIFYLKLDEIYDVVNEDSKDKDRYKQIISKRKDQYINYETINLPNRFITHDKNAEAEIFNNLEVPIPHEDKKTYQGIACSPGIVRASVELIDASTMDRDLKGKIMVAERTDPGWIPIYPTISGLLVERGSLLSHSAIVAREMGIPTIVGVPNLTKILKTGTEIEMNGATGRITII